MARSSPAVAAWESLFRAQVAVMRRLTTDFPEDAISFGEYDVLLNLAFEPGHALPMRALTENVLLSQPSVSRLVARLADRGILEKREHPTDARATIVAITPAGMTVFRRVARLHGASIESRIDGALDETDMAELRRICDKLRRGVTQKR
jgi:DNA-binding MarR family transcriptional regulator